MAVCGNAVKPPGAAFKLLRCSSEADLNYLHPVVCWFCCVCGAAVKLLGNAFNMFKCNSELDLGYLPQCFVGFGMCGAAVKLILDDFEVFQCNSKVNLSYIHPVACWFNCVWECGQAVWCCFQIVLMQFKC